MKIYKHLGKPTSIILLSLNAKTGFGGVMGNGYRTLNPSLSPHDLSAVQSSKTLGSFGRFGLGLSADWAQNPLPYLDSSRVNGLDKAKSFKSQYAHLDPSLLVGLGENLDLGLSTPQLIGQSISDNGDRAQFRKLGGTEYRVHAKYRLWHNDSSGLAISPGAVFDRTEQSPYGGQGRHQSYTLELIADHRVGPWLLISNFGYQWKKNGAPMLNEAGESPITPISDRALAGFGLSYQINEQWAFTSELFGAHNDDEIDEKIDRSSSFAEALTGFKYQWQPQWVLKSGLGTELIHGHGTADLRAYLGLYWISGSGAKDSRTPLDQRADGDSQTLLGGARPDQIIVIRDVLFEFDKDTLSHKDAEKNLQVLVDALKGPKGLSKLVIEGHTDSMGSDAYNLDLSRRRAAAIKTWLVNKGYAKPDLVVTVGYGETRPVATNNTDEGRQLNRRVEFKIYHQKNAKIN